MKLKIMVLVVAVLICSNYAFAAGGHNHEEHKGSMAEHHEGKEGSDAVSVNNKICLVSGENVEDMGGGIEYEYDGKTYYFCCPSCIDTFKADPEKYISKIKEFNFEAYQFGYSPERIEVKKGDIVRILATSRDVPHGIYIKEYDVNTPVKKGEVQKIEFIANETGEFDILCSVYCGGGHHNMKAVLVVLE